MTEENKTKIKSFTDLDAWKEAHKLALLIMNTLTVSPAKKIWP